MADAPPRPFCRLTPRVRSATSVVVSELCGLRVRLFGSGIIDWIMCVDHLVTDTHLGSPTDPTLIN